MKRQLPREETARVIVLAAGLWALVIAAATFEGAFARFDTASQLVLAAFVSVFAVGSLFLDVQLRDYARRMQGPLAFALALGFGAAFVVALALRSAPLAMFFAPLAAMATAASTTRGGGRAKSAAPAKSPGATRAAI